MGGRLAAALPLISRRNRWAFYALILFAFALESGTTHFTRSEVYQAQPFSTVPPPQATFERPFTQESPSSSDFGNLDGVQSAPLSTISGTKSTAAALLAVGAVWAARLGGFALWRGRRSKLSKLNLQSLPKPCDRAQLVAGAVLIVVVNLFLGLPAAYVIIAGGGVTPLAIAAEIFETIVVLPLNLVGLYFMGESGCISMGQSAQ